LRSKRIRGHRLATVRGILIPINWDEDGNVLVVGLAGIDEKEYLIDNHGRHEELLKLIRKEVEIHGLLREQAGKEVITMQGFAVIQEKSDGETHG